MNSYRHISEGDLASMIDGGLSSRDEATAVRHLDGCAQCQRELEAAAGAADWWNDARRFLSPDDTSELPHNAEARAGEDIDAPQLADVSLDFLAPTDDPAMLGRIGVYEIVGVIGRGGTGIVFKAFERALNRFVAIKVLASHLAASGAARKRFAREAQAAAAVVHEHVVHIHAVDEHAGLPYIVMQYVPGRSLQNRLTRQGPLEVREVLRIGLQTAAGLAAAHAQGLVHRDIKPANILLENGIERVLITDFGLARTVDDASLTCSGVIAGTPQYMAPEQARGEVVDHRTDLFSVGSVLYALCAGHSPFRAETTMGVLHRICNEHPRSLREVNPAVPSWLEQIIRKLHSKDPARRFQSAAELAEALQRRLARLQRHGAGEDWRQRLADRARETPRWMRVAVAGLLVVAAFTFATRRWMSPEPPNGLRFAKQATRAGIAPNLNQAQASVHRTATSIQEALPHDASWQEFAQEVELANREASAVEAAIYTPASDADHWAEDVQIVRDEIERLERETGNNSRRANATSAGF